MSGQSTHSTYQPPVAKLLSAGEVKHSKKERWKNYRQKYGLTEADIPELIRMMTDDQLWNSEDIAEAYSAVHAWRALGQLKAIEAIRPLLSLWDDYEDDDWLSSEAPTVFELIGSQALPVLSEALANTSLKEWARSSASEGILKIGKAEPEQRDACVEILRRQLEAYNDNGLVFNGMLVSALVEFKAVETVDLIEQVYAAKQIDDMIPGTWAYIQIKFGLKQRSDFTKDELQPQFFKNMAASRLLRNLKLNDDLDGLGAPPPDDWYEYPVTPSGFGEGFLEIPKQSVPKPVQGFGQGGVTKGNKKKKKK
ncbi:PBS lyase [Oscillatoria sp. FACHB-1407]|uniref:HEAT repeat domain-containing protein n=1 Tax=Oscillatoria sp. FACHB-1407 TaxID=2692847 RepID=UPI001686D6EE|nr:PBS lyase [Oscillatoria sp. FACHB-1407]MBD2462150.1 PBS lyase [Oscillatoria sp. FACHB-1407]